MYFLAWTSFAIWIALASRVNIAMVKALEQAIAELAGLPDSDQEQIGRQLLSHVEKLRKLRDEIDKDIRSLDAGDGRTVDIDKFVRQKSG
jgi:hypothetical protein